MATDEDVYCTLVMNDAYLPGAAVLAHSLRDCGTSKKLACMVLQDSLRASSIQELQSLYNYVIPIERIGNPNPANLYLMNRPDLLYAFTKIHAWRLTQFRKLIYLDADVVALRAPDELFDTQESFAAAPDVGWPDAFNTGVMVISPHMGDYNALRGMAQAGDSFDGADQGLINQYYEHRPWKRISFTYNTTPSANYQYEPAYRYYKRDITMVHFIGAEKPWARGRTAAGTPGAFQEMLSRWWAVYDRHFTVSTADYVEGKTKAIQEYVHQSGHQSGHQQPANNYYATGYPLNYTPPAPPPSFPMPIGAPSGGSSTPPMTEPGEHVENIDQGIIMPASTVEQRRFSAPQMEWDATRAAPPSASRPEAANFPTQTYAFNHDPEPFRPPPAYPEPPKDMWYKVPEKPQPTETLKPLFPWEERELPKPTRRFIDDIAQPSSQSDFDTGYDDELEVKLEPAKELPVTPTIKITNDNPWEAFASNKNAWDEDSGIDNYVRSLTAFQRNRGKVQVLPTTGAVRAQPSQAGIMSPISTEAPDPEDLVAQVEKRRESMLITDFPTALERPSLPVTPAPIRRPTFWGEEREEEIGLMPAEGVPEQSEWNPNAQLEQLRRNSLLGAGDLKLPPRKNLPDREMPSTAAPIPEEEEIHPQHVESSTTGHIGLATEGEDRRMYVPISGASSPHGLVALEDTSISRGLHTSDKSTTNATYFPTAVDSTSTEQVSTTVDPTSTQQPESIDDIRSIDSQTEASNKSSSYSTNSSSTFDEASISDLTIANTAFNASMATSAAQQLFAEPGFHVPSTDEEIENAREAAMQMTSEAETAGLLSPTSVEPNTTTSVTFEGAEDSHLEEDESSTSKTFTSISREFRDSNELQESFRESAAGVGLFGSDLRDTGALAQQQNLEEFSEAGLGLFASSSHDVGNFDQQQSFVESTEGDSSLTSPGSRNIESFGQRNGSNGASWFEHHSSSQQHGSTHSSSSHHFSSSTSRMFSSSGGGGGFTEYSSSSSFRPELSGAKFDVPHLEGDDPNGSGLLGSDPEEAHIGKGSAR